MTPPSVRKVCFVVPQAYLFFNPARGTPFGGAERQAYYLGTELARRPGYEVHYCVADFGQGEAEEREGCRLWPAFSFAEGRLAALWKILAALKRIDADVYVFRAANPAIFPLAFYLQRKMRKRCVYMVAHRSEGSFRELARMAGTPTAFLMALAYRAVDALCVQTEEQGRAFEKIRPEGGRLVPNLFRPTIESQEGEKSFDCSLWVGRAEKWKRPELFLDLARRHPGERFVMVCPAGRAPELFGRLQKESRKLSNLEFSGGMPPRSLADLYRRAKMYVLTSEAEGFANTMMEAMAAETPVLTLGVDPDGIIARHRAGVVAPDLDTLSHHVAALAGDPELCRRLGENGKRYILAHHLGPAVIDRFADVLG